MAFSAPKRRALDLPIRPTRVEISEGALRRNFARATEAAGPAQVLAVVKANAYGHGAVQVARVLEDAGATLFGVALVEEGVELRHAGVKSPILVMGGSYDGGYGLMVEHRLTATLFRREHVEGLAQAARAAGVAATAHLKLDTGMSRLGVSPDELGELLGLLRAARGAVELEGFMSHFANADLEDDPLTPRQVARFREGLRQVRDAGFNPRYRHLANSAGLLGLPGLADGLDINLVRPGLMLYGLTPDAWLDGRQPLEPVLTWKTGVIHLKTVPKGTAVSYGGIWTAPRDTVVATLPVGYADGYSRDFSSKGEVLLRGRRAPIVGRVTMDMCMADVTDLPGTRVGDEVVLLGGQGAEQLRAEALGAIANTLHYEVLCRIGARVPRLLVP
ncbi:MAG: alanine racemase [Myxococcaceae bacterium]|nr:alanine racemase [Myxococcaceae bacterium]